MKKISYILITILCIILLINFISIPAFAVSQADADKVKEQINETENEIKQVEENMSEAMKEIQKLEGDIDEVAYNLQTLQENLTKLNGEISILEENLKEATEKYNERLDSARTRMIAQYKYGNMTFLDVLLNSTSLSEFLSNYYLVGQILESDEDFLNELEDEKNRIEQDKKELESKKATLEEQKQKVERQKIELANKKAEKEKKVSTLNAEEAELQQQKEEYYTELNRIQEELSRIARQNGTSGSSYSGGVLQFPCTSYIRVSSWFGGRGAPLAGGSSYHKGVDLAASMGSSILAAESGTVIAVYKGCSHNYGKSRSCGCGGGFGNYVMISHGSGLVTVYAHCTTIYVNLGDTVTRGETIATVGTTGASTGSHLHFGTLLNGTYVDPAPYIGL